MTGEGSLKGQHTCWVDIMLHQPRCPRKFMCILVFTAGGSLPGWLSEVFASPISKNTPSIYYPNPFFSEYFHLSFRNFMTAFATASYDLGYVPNLISRWRFDETQLLGVSVFPAVHQAFHQTTPTKKHKPTFFFWKQAENNNKINPLK